MNFEDINRIAAVRRLPGYLARAVELQSEGANATLSNLAKRMNLSEDLIKSDLCKLGAATLIGPYAGGNDMREILEAILLEIKPVEAVMIADGLLGKMLMERFSLLGPGVNILIAFDADEKSGGRQDLPKQILPLYKFTEMVERIQVKLGILCVPHAKAAQYMELMKAAGITAIWNWSGCQLPRRDDLLVINEDCRENGVAVFEGPWMQ